VTGGVFISYRRDDSAGYAGRIFDRLSSRLGHDAVFFDVDTIQPGRDFVEVLSERVGACDALIAIIGKQWIASADGENRRRLDDPNDFVRIEIEVALKRNVPVIPVLVDGAAMPRADQLPDGLKTLVRRQAVEISHARFDSDAERLTDALAEIEGQPFQRTAIAAQPASVTPETLPRATPAEATAAANRAPQTSADAAASAPLPRAKPGRLPLVLVAVALVLVAAAAAWFFAQRGASPEQKTAAAAASGSSLAAVAPPSNGTAVPNAAPPASSNGSPAAVAPASVSPAAVDDSPDAAPATDSPATDSPASVSPAKPAELNGWISRDDFAAEFKKEAANGNYPDSLSAKCEDGVVKMRAHWSSRPRGMTWLFFALGDDGFQAKNTELTGRGFVLQYDNAFKNCEGHSRHQALWTKNQ